MQLIWPYGIQNLLTVKKGEKLADKSSKIDVDHEMRRTHTAAYSAGGMALLGYSGMAATSVTILGGSIMATGWIPVVGWAAAAAAGSYLLFKAYKDHQKVNCLEFAKQINISIKENHDPRVNSTTQQKIGRAAPADSAVKLKMLTTPAAH